jgi:putative alpha-1,2-mannosidase
MQKVSGAATAEWNGLLGRVAVSGGSKSSERTFYTALYHSLLFPSVFSDDDGRYIGFDHRVHTLPKGEVQYSNFSECDIYRTEVPLLATLLPGPTSQMIQSLFRDAAQTKGHYLPKWVIAANNAGEWDGDSVDPVIADAYAYGARKFNVKDALALMIHGATVPGKRFHRGTAEPRNSTRTRAGSPTHVRRHLLSHTPLVDRRHSSTRSTTSQSPNSPLRSATRVRRRRSPSGARTGRTCSIPARVTSLPAR